jgi:hypothetical protein
MFPSRDTWSFDMPTDRYDQYIDDFPKSTQYVPPYQWPTRQHAQRRQGALLWGPAEQEELGELAAVQRPHSRMRWPKHPVKSSCGGGGNQKTGHTRCVSGGTRPRLGGIHRSTKTPPLVGEAGRSRRSWRRIPVADRVLGGSGRRPRAPVRAPGGFECRQAAVGRTSPALGITQT